MNGVSLQEPFLVSQAQDTNTGLVHAIDFDHDLFAVGKQAIADAQLQASARVDGLRSALWPEGVQSVGSMSRWFEATASNPILAALPHTSTPGPPFGLSVLGEAGARAASALGEQSQSEESDVEECEEAREKIVEPLHPHITNCRITELLVVHCQVED